MMELPCGEILREIRAIGTDAHGGTSMPVLTGGEDDRSMAEVGGKTGEAWVGWSGGEDFWLNDRWGGEGFECAEGLGEQAARGEDHGAGTELEGERNVEGVLGVGFGVFVVFVVRSDADGWDVEFVMGFGRVGRGGLLAIVHCWG